MKDSVVKYPSGWVRESTFGNWFLNSDIWVYHVLKLSLDALEKLLSSKDDKYSAILDVGCGFGHSLLELDRRFNPEIIIGP